MPTHNHEDNNTGNTRASGREYHIEVVESQVTDKGLLCI